MSIYDKLNDVEKEELEHYRVHLLTSKAESTVGVYSFYTAKLMIFIRKYYKPGNLQYVINKLLSEEIATGQVARAAIKKYLKYKKVTEPYEMPEGKRRTRIIKTCTETEIQQILGMTNGYANKLLIQLAYRCALRNKETVTLQVKNVILEPPRRISVIGKGNKERNVYINDRTAEMLHDYMEEYGLKQPEDYLFSRMMKLKHPTRHFRYIMTRASKKLFIDSKKKIISPHKLRHARATKMVEQGVPIQIIQQHLGHASIETTTLYTHLNEKTILKELQKAEPKENYEIEGKKDKVINEQKQEET